MTKKQYTLRICTDEQILFDGAMMVKSWPAGGPILSGAENEGRPVVSDRTLRARARRAASLPKGARVAIETVQ
jgi:hypothetical protein